MLNQSGISKVSATTEKTILIAPELAFALSCKVANTGVSAGADGKKIIKAGTPLAGNMEARETAFTVGTDANAVGIILHDVDVTDGTKNAQVCTFGFVDSGKLDSTVAAMFTSGMRTKLADIHLVK